MHRTKAMRNVTRFLRDEVAQSGNLSLFFFLVDGETVEP